MVYEFEDFYAEYKEIYGSDVPEEVTNVIDSVCCGDEDEVVSDKWEFDIDKVKHHALQYTFYLSGFLIEDPDVCFSMEIENGIDAGTVLVDYSVESSGNPTSFIKRVRTGIAFNEEYWSKMSKLEYNKAKAMFNANKDTIEEILRKQSYDNYVSGGGTTTLDDYHRKEIKPYKELYINVYEDIEYFI